MAMPERGHLKLAFLIFVALLFAAVLLLVLFFERGNPARKKCQSTPDAACTCAGIRGEHVYGCECCAASPCRPQADLDLDKALKAERKAAKAEHDLKHNHPLP